MSLEVVEWAASCPLVLPYFDVRVPAGFPSPAEDYLETELDMTEYLVENKAATFAADEAPDGAWRRKRLVGVEACRNPVPLLAVPEESSKRSERRRFGCGLEGLTGA